MSKEKIFIVLFQKQILSRAARRGRADTWEVEEKVEFVTQLRKSHTDSSVAVGDFTNKKMIKGASNNMGDYNKFILYIERKYPEQFNELIKAYGDDEGTGACVENESEAKTATA